MAQEDSKDIEEFKEIFLSLTELFGCISNDEAFKSIHGFSMTEFISLRRSCADKIREVAENIERVVKNTGIARTTGGAAAVLAGTAILGGIVLAPFTSGFSLALTIGGIAGGIASAATTLTATIIKDTKVKSTAKEVKKLRDSLIEKDKVVNEVIKELQEKVKKMQSLYKKKSIIDFIGDGAKLAKWAKGITYNIAYKGYVLYSYTKAARFAMAVAEFIQADVFAMRGVAVGMSAPGLSLFGKALVIAGSTSAKVLSGAFSAVGIGFGIWDIIAGAKDIKGSKHNAEAYRNAAADLDKQTDSYAELLEKIKESDKEQ